MMERFYEFNQRLKDLGIKINTMQMNELIHIVQGNPPIELHFWMFLLTIKNLGTDEQQKKWVPDATHLRIHGCYAQTELGHGSNVAGLQTTATFDPQTDEFVLNTPSIEAYKFWPGELGVCATHAVVFARLISKGKDYGV